MAKYSVKSHDVKIDVKMGPVGSCVVCLVCDLGLLLLLLLLLFMLKIMYKNSVPASQ
jgi:hypothetical protein